MRNEFTAIIEPASEGGFWAHCPEVQGASGPGDTVDEALEDLASSIELVLDVLRPEGAKAMTPGALVEVVRLA